MVWVVETLNATVDAELEALPADQIAKFLRIGGLIEALGLEREILGVNEYAAFRRRV